MLKELQWSELLIIRSRSLHNKQSPITSQHQVLYVQEETRHRLDLRSRQKRFPGLADWLIVGKEGKHSCEFVHSSQVLLRPFRNVFNSRNSCGLWTCRWSIDWYINWTNKGLRFVSWSLQCRGVSKRILEINSVSTALTYAILCLGVTHYTILVHQLEDLGAPWTTAQTPQEQIRGFISPHNWLLGSFWWFYRR